MVVVHSASEVLERGLQLAGVSGMEQQRVQRKTNIRKFNNHFGSHPHVIAAIFDDLQTTTVARARISGHWVDLDKLLHACYFLKRYRTEDERATKGDKGCDKSIRAWTWYFVEKIQALKATKVSSVLLILFL